MKTKPIYFSECNNNFYIDNSSKTWLKYKVGTRKSKIDSDAGSVRDDGYYIVELNDSLYLVHRLIYCIWSGEDLVSDLHIDHIDGNVANNNPFNLRLVDTKTNMRNQKKQNSNQTGITGVSFYDNGFGNYYYVATWKDSQNKYNRKYFSVDKLGKLEAFQLACDLRFAKIEELNNTGAGYTNRHGF